MDFKQLEAFCLVVKLGSFSKAAKALDISQPTISTHISSLEKELRCELLIRTSKSILPTDKGIMLLNYAQNMMNMRQQAIEELSKPEAKYTGSITIASSTVPAQYCLPELLSDFRKKYPGISYQLHNVNSAQAVDEVRKGTADIALTGAKIENTNCTFKSFLKDELVIITPNTPRFQAFNGTFPMELLTQEPFITREGGSGTRMEFEMLLKNYGIEPSQLNLVAEMSFIESIKKSVISGLGIAIMSVHAIADELSSGKLLSFRLDQQPMNRELYLVIRHNRSEMSLAALFFSFAEEHFGLK